MLLLLFISLATSYTFINTKNLYNGTTGYDGLFRACIMEYGGSKPCTNVQLLDGFWRSKNLQLSWVLDLYVNCLAYTTNSSYTDGTCIYPFVNQLTTCTCEMLLPICCYR